jgi:hypothetical protein
MIVYFSTFLLKVCYIHKMRNKFLLFIFLLFATVGHAEETYESAGVAPQFIVELDENNVFGALFEAGSNGYYRGNLTWAAQGSEQHWFKVSGEYLLEHQDINFESDPRNIWVDQYAAGGTYQYFPSLNWPVAVLGNTYMSYAPSERVNDFQRISEAIAYGGNAGVDVFFPTRTQIEALLRYDVATFHNAFSADNTEQGIGGSGFIKQYIGCDLNLTAGTDITAIYNNYYTAFNMLFPFGTQAFQIGIKGAYNVPHENLTRSLIGMVTFGLQPQQGCGMSESKRETLASFASRPAVYMPTVLAKLDQEGSGLTVFIPDFTFFGITTTYDISGFFSQFGPGPLTYQVNGALGAGTTFDPTTGVIDASGSGGVVGDFPVSVTATNSKGQSVTSNVFILTYIFP